MGIGSSTLGAAAGAWRNTSHTPATAAHPAPTADDFDPGEPDAPVSVAEVHEFLEQRADRWRAPDPAALPTRWPATALQLWADLTRQVERVRQASAPTRQIRSVPHDADAEPAQPAAPASQQSAPAGGGSGTAIALLRPEPDRLQSAHTFPVQATEATAAMLPEHHAANSGFAIAPHQYVARRLDQLEPSLLPDYLKAAGCAAPRQYVGCAPRPQVLIALHEHLAPARIAGGDPVIPDRFNAHALLSLMRYAMRELGFFCARYGEKIAPAFQRQVLIKLISQWANGCMQTPARIAGYSWSEAARQRRTVTQIKEEVASRLQASGLPHEVGAWAGDVLLAGTEPALVRADTPGDLRYGSLEWADLQTGIDTASALGLDHWSLTYAELAALAQAVDMMVRQQPDAASGLLALQVRTALVFAGESLAADDPPAGERIEAALTALTDARTERWDALQQRQDILAALHAPLPTRSQLAERILFDHGIHPDQTFFTPPLHRTSVVGGHVEPVTDTALNLYLDGRRSWNGARLPDADAQFNQDFTQYKTKFQDAIALLYGEAIAALPAEDRVFWQNGNARILVPECKINLFPSGYRATYRAQPQTAIAAITHEGHIRHYLVAPSDNDLPVRFIALDPKVPGKTLAREGKKLFTAAQWPSIELASTWRYGGPSWVLPAWGSGPAISVLAQYFAEPIEKLREQAYAPTANQQALQRIQDAMLSLIPFYNCVTGVQAGNAGGGVLLSCALDVVGLIPVVGTVLKVGVGAGKLSLQVATSALRQLAQTSAKGLLSRQTLHTAVAEIARAAALATSFARSSGKALAWDAANLFDPGFQLLRSVGKGVHRSGHALMESLRQSPGLRKLADRIGAALKRQRFHFDAQAGVWQMHRRAIVHRDGRQLAQIGGREVEVIDMGTSKHVPVARLDDSADDVRFALLDPRSGLPYGAQWVPTPNGFEALGEYRVRLDDPLHSPMPAADPQGIIHSGGRDHIRMDGQYYRVEQDPHDPVWRILHPDRNAARRIPVRFNADGDWETFSLGLKGGQPVTTPEESFTLPTQDVVRGGERFSITHEKAGTPEAAMAAGNWRQELEAVLDPDHWRGAGDAVLEDRAYIASHRRVFDALPLDQRRAIRAWTYAEEPERYASPPQVDDAINYDLNDALRGGAPITAEHKKAYVDLRAGLHRLPSVAGETTLMRVADVAGDYCQHIRVNDIVTNTPMFMSASSAGNFGHNVIIEQSAAHGPVSAQSDAMLAFYVIDARTAKPFIGDVSTHAIDEREWLFPPDTLFKVDSISTARRIGHKEKTRLVIRLTEIEHPRDQAGSVAKNIHTGERMVVRRPADWSPQPGTPAADPEFLFDYQYADWVEDLPDVTHRISGEGTYVSHRGEDYRKATLLLVTTDQSTIYLDVLTEQVSTAHGTIHWQVVGQDGRQLPLYVTFDWNSVFVGTLHIEARADASRG